MKTGTCTAMVFLMTLLTVFQSAEAQHPGFMNIVEYETWAHKPLGTSGYGIPPQEIDWTGVDVVFHFDNDQIASNVPPYFGYVNKGNAFSDSTQLFIGGYAVQLEQQIHAVGGSLVLQINAVGPEKLITIVVDSTKTEIFTTSVALWCQRHSYDGIDINWETTLSGTTLAQRERFFRIFRRNLDRYRTTPRGRGAIGGKPWLSITSPVDWHSQWSLLVDSYLNRWCLQVGTMMWLEQDVWWSWPIHAGPNPSSPPSCVSNPWLIAMADQINATSTFGMRAWVERGYSKSKIAPASAIGSTLFRGTDWIYTCRSATTNVSDLWRGGVRYDGLTNEAEILANGGTRHYDPTFGVSYINGTATKSTWGDAKIGLSTGQRFLWMCEDSISMYAKTNWLVQNGWGGICPYSVTEDVNPWLPKPRRLNAHRGIVAALGRISK